MKIKVICLNLWHGGELFDGILKFLEAEDADVLLLQEVNNGADPALPVHLRSIEVLQDALKYPYYDFAPAALDRFPEGKVESGNAVFSKFPITARDVVFFDHPYRECDALDESEFPTMPRNLQKVAIDANGTSVNLFNFHGVWDLNGNNYSPQRRRMSQIIIEATKDQPHVVLAGDTNARSTNQAMIDIEAHLTSVFGRELPTTFNMLRKSDPGYGEACVDLMFVTPDIKVLEKSCPNVDISDHLPLVVTLDIV